MEPFNPINPQRLTKKQIICMYCEEEAQYISLIQKPQYFIYENSIWYFPDAGHLICMPCLHEEMQNLKECY